MQERNNRGASQTRPNRALHTSTDNSVSVEMTKLDLLIIGPKGSGKTSMMRAFAKNEEQKLEEHPLHEQVGMTVTTQYYQYGSTGLEQTVKLSLWDPAMREITAQDTQNQDLIGINQQLRLRYQKEIRFHGVLVCYDSTKSESFTEATRLYKELMSDPEDVTKVSQYSKIPVAFVATKLDLTDFLISDASALPRCIAIADLRIWLAKVHRRSENACLETSAVDNIGVSIMVEWIVGAATRAYPAVEQSKVKSIERFSAPLEASDKNLLSYLAGSGNLPVDTFDEEL